MDWAYIVRGERGVEDVYIGRECTPEEMAPVRRRMWDRGKVLTVQEARPVEDLLRDTIPEIRATEPVTAHDTEPMGSQ